jgi:cyclopropane fatty-acyl-phospholipid synthase-like methyltransferase
MPLKGSFELEYQKDKNYWGSKPSSIIKDKFGLLRKGSLLDIGAGDGRNVLFLAEHGFNVTALDIAPTGLLAINEKAKKRMVSDRVKTVEADFIGYQTTDTFDNIITNFTLHFVGADNIIPFLDKMTGLTKTGGINVIDDFTQNSPLAKTSVDDYINETILSDYYLSLGWKIIYSCTRYVPVKAFESKDEKLQGEAIAFIAQKT